MGMGWHRLPTLTFPLVDYLCSTGQIVPPITTNTTIVDVVSSRCLSNVVAPLMPMLLSPICAIFLVIYANVFTASTGLAWRSRTSTLKLIISATNLSVAIINAIVVFSSPEDLPELKVGVAINILFAVFALISYAVCISGGIVSSMFLHLIWFLQLISLIPQTIFTIHRVFQEFSSYIVLDTLQILVFFLCAATMCILLYWADQHCPSAGGGANNNYQPLQEENERITFPDGQISALSSFFYSYAVQLIWKGYRGTVGYQDLWTFQKWMKSEFLLERYYASGVNLSVASQKRISIFLWRLICATWETVLAAMFFSIFIVMGRYLNAFFLRVIVQAVSNQTPTWVSIVALSTLFLTDFASKLLTARRDFTSFISYFSMRSILCSIIYDKSMCLSSAARSRYSAGEILNIVTTDVQRLRNFWWSSRDILYCPLMVSVALVGLYIELGWSVCFGIVILITVLPVNFGLTRLMSHYEQLMMKIKDNRMKLMNDVLSGMRVLKLYAWEPSMQTMIAELRYRETVALRKIFIIDMIQTLSFQLAPIFATLASFYGYSIIQKGSMTPDVAFVSILLFGMLRLAIYLLPVSLASAIKAYVSSGRILKFLNEEEKQKTHIKSAKHVGNGHGPENGSIQDSTADFVPTDESSTIVSINNCSFTWESGTASATGSANGLSQINLEVLRGELVGIVGRVGSGKSSLISALLGEMKRVENGGNCVVFANSIGYAPQTAWIQNKTLRDNILFGKQFDDEYYKKTLKACALLDDLALLPARDMTEIGEKGINLSGGQKARVALARAVYQKADFNLLDDTLSAVDAHVGAHIFNHVIASADGLMGNSTRLFALNTLSFLRYCDKIVVMNEGRIHEIGTYDQLKQKKDGPFADLLREYLEKQAERHRNKHKRQPSYLRNDGLAGDDELDTILKDIAGSPLSESVLDALNHPSSVIRSRTSSISANVERTSIKSSNVPTSLRTRTRSRYSSASSNALDQHLPSTFDAQTDELNQQVQVTLDVQRGQEDSGKLIEEEELATGSISWRVYKEYCNAFGWFYTVGFVSTVFIGMSFFDALGNVWLAGWTAKVDQRNGTTPGAASEDIWYLGGYGIFELCIVLSTLIWGSFLTIGAFNASVKFHNSLVESLFHAPMAFFERTPLGRIINRLSSDIDRIDEDVPMNFSWVFWIFGSAISSLISIVIMIPALLAIVVPLVIAFIVIVQIYNISSIQFRRLTSKAWSRLCSYIQDSYMGADSIRAFDAIQRFRSELWQIVDVANESYMAEIVANRWIQVKLDFMTDIAVFIFVLIAILLADQKAITIGALAMVISSGFSFTGFLGEIARGWRETNTAIVAVERISEYIALEPEAAWRSKRPRNWPSQGRITFQDFSFRYRPTSEPILHELNFEINPGEKVGIVGRTGAGKTSMTIALFRIVEAHLGRILIDGVDIASIGLHDLREALTIIPQDPMLFCGTLRSNLDPFGQFTEADLWSALEKAHLSEAVRGFEAGLAHEIAEGGNNLSVGQRQLVCLARALLRKTTKILVLDEATASIDVETDRLIQLSIRSNFGHCTILTIAHRLNTVLDYDRILVLDAGRVIEFDSPQLLLRRPGSAFAALAKQAGIDHPFQSASSFPGSLDTHGPMD